MRRQCIAVALTALAILPGTVLAQAPGSLLPFVQKFKGQFPSEIKDKPAFEKIYVGRVHHEYVVTLEFDDARSELTLGNPKWDYLVLRSCIRTGEGTGATAMGVQAQYVRQTCNEVTLRDSSGSRSEVRFTSTAATYRQIKSKGIDIETVVRPRIGAKPPVEYVRVPRPPSLDNRYETLAHFYTLDADVVERRYYVPGGKVPIMTEKLSETGK